MPRPPETGCYVTTNRDGQALIVQYSDGRPVEVLLTRATTKPKRRTTRYLGPSWGAVLYEHERRKREAFWRAWAEHVESRHPAAEGGAR